MPVVEGLGSFVTLLLVVVSFGMAVAGFVGWICGLSIERCRQCGRPFLSDGTGHRCAGRHSLQLLHVRARHAPPPSRR